VTAAAALSYPFPLATALESSALVAAARGAAAEDVAPWISTADELRRRGDRPVPAPLAAQVAGLTGELPAVDPLPLAEVVASVDRLLGSSA
jgi:hypothetical protein